MRWKAHLTDSNYIGHTNPLFHIFKSRKCPPQHKELVDFENGLLELIKNVTSRKVYNIDINNIVLTKSIRKSDNVFIFADKTRNLYETSKENCNKLLTENITKTYRKATNNIYSNINKEAKAVANNYEIAERIDCLPMTDASITLRDHKPNFNNNPKCRLINPSNSELGKISKFLIEKVNTIIRDKSLVNQRRDTDTVINWFKNIDNKNNCIFMQFDIEEFYPSISKGLLMKAIDHAQSFVTINKEEVKTIMHFRKSLLFNNTSVWIKRLRRYHG